MQIIGEIVTDFRGLLHPISSRQGLFGDTVNRADQRKFLNCPFISHECLHYQAKQVHPVLVALFDRLFVVVFDKAINAHSWIIGSKFEDKKCPITTTARMETCEIAGKCLTALFESILLFSHSLNLCLGLRTVLESKDCSYISLTDTFDEELFMLYFTGRFGAKFIIAHDMQDHAFDAQRCGIFICYERQTIPLKCLYCFAYSLDLERAFCNAQKTITSAFCHLERLPSLT